MNQLDQDDDRLFNAKLDIFSLLFLVLVSFGVVYLFFYHLLPMTLDRSNGVVLLTLYAVVMIVVLHIAVLVVLLGLPWLFEAITIWMERRVKEHGETNNDQADNPYWYSNELEDKDY